MTLQMNVCEKIKYFKGPSSLLMSILGIRDIDKMGNFKAIQIVPFHYWFDGII